MGVFWSKLSDFKTKNVNKSTKVILLMGLQRLTRYGLDQPKIKVDKGHSKGTLSKKENKKIRLKRLNIQSVQEMSTLILDFPDPEAAKAKAELAMAITAIIKENVGSNKKLLKSSELINLKFPKSLEGCFLSLRSKDS
jgi:hypothetical protein